MQQIQFIGSQKLMAYVDAVNHGEMEPDAAQPFLNGYTLMLIRQLRGDIYWYYEMEILPKITLPAEEVIYDVANDMEIHIERSIFVGCNMMLDKVRASNLNHYAIFKHQKKAMEWMTAQSAADNARIELEAALQTLQDSPTRDNFISYTAALKMFVDAVEDEVEAMRWLYDLEIGLWNSVEIGEIDSRVIHWRLIVADEAA
ncbi:hypothetical protein U9S86_004558 [Salmonella enterica]|nr:hypothetical protein [Salmonella enterica]EHA9546173.1 hypothetical protein [Salmonella enterica subsp. enterica serovar Braenderup]EHP7123045.1 hypothetical protein [Salmonella enterica subsp. enterica serovar Thompson]EBH4941555.1 hypothetical protein [Salmonella enterica]ECK3278479.1 hypothetical protein [Salmonella enterica]